MDAKDTTDAADTNDIGGSVLRSFAGVAPSAHVAPEFGPAIATPKKRDARRRGSSGDRATSGRARGGSSAPEGTGGTESGVSAVAPISSVASVASVADAPSVAKDAASVLRRIEALAGRKDYFDALETALKENVSVLVPDYMSFADFSKTLSNLRESNLEVKRASGASTDDPLGAIRDFLSGKEGS